MSGPFCRPVREAQEREAWAHRSNRGRGGCVGWRPTIYNGTTGSERAREIDGSRKCLHVRASPAAAPGTTDDGPPAAAWSTEHGARDQARHCLQSSLVDHRGFGLESRWVVCARPRTNESIKKTESRAWLAVELVDHYTQSRRSMHCKYEVNWKSCEVVLGQETPVSFCLEWDHNKYEGERIDLRCRVSR
jgi:hypothetical protein